MTDLKPLYDAVLEGNLPTAKSVTEQALAAGVDPQTGKVVRLFDPRRQNWRRHFQWNGALLEGRTSSGRATVRTLRINMNIRVEFRQSLIDIGEFPPPNA